MSHVSVGLQKESAGKTWMEMVAEGRKDCGVNKALFGPTFSMTIVGINLTSAQALIPRIQVLATSWVSFEDSDKLMVDINCGTY